MIKLPTKFNEIIDELVDLFEFADDVLPSHHHVNKFRDFCI
ncbi:MAG: hypothetical protein ACJ0O7_04550 [Flavobacteriaceae bacterium]